MSGIYSGRRWAVILILLSISLWGCGPTSFLITPVSGQRELRESRIHRDAGLWVVDKIAVIEVDGLMVNKSSRSLLEEGENPVSLFLEKLERARKDEEVKAVVLRLNSPGGTVGASDLMYHALRDFRKTTGKPVVACLLDVAASGAYYLACGCDGIMAQPTSITGSIGIIFQTVSFAGTMDKLGITAEAIKSGDLKDMASPLRPLGDQERQILQKLVMHFYENFLEVVLAGRAGLTREKLQGWADGRVFTAEQAKEAGLIDKIGYPLEAVAWAKQLAGVEKARVVIYHRPIGYKPNIYATASTNVEAGALVNIEIPEWLRAEGPQFLYLWQVGDLSAR